MIRCSFTFFFWTLGSQTEKWAEAWQRESFDLNNTRHLLYSELSWLQADTAAVPVRQRCSQPLILDSLLGLFSVSRLWHLTWVLSEDSWTQDSRCDSLLRIPMVNLSILWVTNNFSEADDNQYNINRWLLQLPKNLDSCDCCEVRVQWWWQLPNPWLSLRRQPRWGHRGKVAGECVT